MTALENKNAGLNAEYSRRMPEESQSAQHCSKNYKRKGAVQSNRRRMLLDLGLLDNSL